MKVDLSTYTNVHSRASLARRLLWEIVWGLFARPTPRWALNGWRVFLLRLFGAKIGPNCRVQGSASVWQPWKLTLGANCWIDAGAKLYSVDEIRLGSNVVVSEGAFLCTASHDIKSTSFDLTTAPISVGDGVWIAARSIVLPGVSLGEDAVVGAGAVVTKDVAPRSVVGGNPARVIGER